MEDYDDYEARRSASIDEAMERRDQREIQEAHRRRNNEIKMRSILRDENVTLLTLEGQLKVCGCFIVLLIAIFGLCASLFCIGYVSNILLVFITFFVHQSFAEWREYDLRLYENQVDVSSNLSVYSFIFKQDWNTGGRKVFEDLPIYIGIKDSTFEEDRAGPFNTKEAELLEF